MQQMKTGTANRETSTGAHSASVLYQMFGGKDYITEEVAGTLSRVVHRQGEHCLLGLSASPYYRVYQCATGGTKAGDETSPTNATMELTRPCSTQTVVHTVVFGGSYKTPLAPCFLCCHCAANDGEVHKISMKLLRTAY